MDETLVSRLDAMSVSEVSFPSIWSMRSKIVAVDHHHVGDVLSRGVLRRHPSQRQLSMATYRRQQVAHVVGDRAEVLGAGLHALRIRGWTR